MAGKQKKTNRLKAWLREQKDAEWGTAWAESLPVSLQLISSMEAPPTDVKRMRPTFHLSPVTQNDVSTLARIFLLAFEADEYKPVLTPHRVGLSTSKLLLQEGPLEERRMRRGLVEKDVLYMKASVRIPDNMGIEKETIVGWAKWVSPPGFRRRSIWEWLWSEILYPLHRFIFRPAIAGLPESAKALLIAQQKDVFGPGGVAEGRKHWYLHLLCVDPAWQGIGGGGTLLKWGLGRAKEMDAAVYLETTVAARLFYVAQGFRVVGERPGRINGIPITIPGMIWEPMITRNI